ncbi:SET domain-containing protein 9 isoform X2 [Ictalurus punctatus]|uniref:SET domain-containing protein 9 isoform X2 n=1 Tax=Ictalurus punctatus TaxID=7998 RepID=A0A2D0SNC7_ICTPU|nr:SET domain-containing protein 9 isoform X2 [Ictalurus punctatus]XP_017343780.1 SET domain-containing protein 9 isoform X2 [Ictalurus punctatus]
MRKNLLKVLEESWKSYRHRFVPWIALNLRKNERTLRQVKHRSEDKRLDDGQVLASLMSLFTELLRNDASNQTEQLRLLPASSRRDYYITHNAAVHRPEVAPRDIMLHTMGFCVEKMHSSLQDAGIGVFITRGQVPKGVPVAMYPGTIYQADEPILFQSIRNPFVFRCIDGILIDGNDKGLSKLVFQSCSGRDRLGPFRLSDSSWLTPCPENPLAVGQYVNNCSNDTGDALFKPSCSRFDPQRRLPTSAIRNLMCLRTFP